VPRMFRIMRKDSDDKPTVGQAFANLGVRPGEVDTDAQGNAIPNHKGMSVAPNWRDIQLFLHPRRLGTGGRGKDNTHCFRRGAAPFKQSGFGNGLELLPDSATHGVVRPAQLVPLVQYLQDLAATRKEWQIDEA
jgi:hypothetical protein